MQDGLLGEIRELVLEVAILNGSGLLLGLLSRGGRRLGGSLSGGSRLGRGGGLSLFEKLSATQSSYRCGRCG